VTELKLTGAVPLVKIAISSPPCSCRAQRTYVTCARTRRRTIALFDKYNLITLAVIDEHGRLSGIITADDVISMLRHR
jgi:Mg/Co/Ni transporter MgtE